jgi:hypothetical protein
MSWEPGDALPEGLRWGNGGGSIIGGCNGYHIAPKATRGTLCGLYAPATIAPPPPGERICGNCSRILRSRTEQA